MTSKPPELELELDSILEKDPTGRSLVVDQEVMVIAVSGDDIKDLSVEDLSVLSQPNLSFVSLPGSSPVEPEQELIEIRSRPHQDAPSPTNPTSHQRKSQENAALSLKIAGKYTLEKKLAEGGEGIVYLARHMGLQLHPMRVIKFLPPEKLGKGDALKRFAQEIELTASLSQKSEHIVRIYDDFGISPELGCFYVMEYLDGCTLREFLREYRPLPLPLALHVFKQLCHGLSAIHLAGILHQDIKPKNIFLLKRTDNPHFVKVGDFGIAKMPFNPNTHFVGNEGAGTPAYMAPEQLLGTEVDFRTDIYALGLILFELIAGQKPFLPRTRTMEEARQELAEAHLYETPPLMQLYRHDVQIPLELEQIVQRSLEKKREDRPSDVREVLKIVEKVDRYLRKYGTQQPGDTQSKHPLHKELPYIEDTPGAESNPSPLIVLDKVKQRPPNTPTPPLRPDEHAPEVLAPAHQSKGASSILPTGMLDALAPGPDAQVALHPPPTPQPPLQAQTSGYAPPTPPISIPAPLGGPHTSGIGPRHSIEALDSLRERDKSAPPTPHNLSGSHAPMIEQEDAPSTSSQSMLPLMWISVVLTTMGLIAVWMLLSQRAKQNPRPSAARQRTTPQTTPQRQPARRAKAPRSIHTAPQRVRPRLTRRRHKRRLNKRRPTRRRPTKRTKLVILEKPPSLQISGCPKDPPKGQWIRLTITPAAARISTRHRQVPWGKGICLLRLHPKELLRIRLTHTRYQPCLIQRPLAKRQYHLRLRVDTFGKGTTPSILDDHLDACLR